MSFEYAPHASPAVTFRMCLVMFPIRRTKLYSIRSSAGLVSRQADLILATDPDCDRWDARGSGEQDLGGEWRTLNGNQLGAVFDRFRFAKAKGNGNSAVQALCDQDMVTDGADSKDR